MIHYVPPEPCPPMQRKPIPFLPVPTPFGGPPPLSAFSTQPANLSQPVSQPVILPDAPSRSEPATAVQSENPAPTVLYPTTKLPRPGKSGKRKSKTNSGEASGTKRQRKPLADISETNQARAEANKRVIRPSSKLREGI